MWPFNLSVRLPIVDLVSRYLTNYLIRYEPIFQRIAPLVYRGCPQYTLCGISSRFQLLSPSERQVAHTLLTRPPLSHSSKLKCFVRLACVRHAASVHPEPGSNSQYIVSQQLSLLKSLLKLSSSQKNFIVISDFKEPFSGAYLA